MISRSLAIAGLSPTGDHHSNLRFYDLIRHLINGLSKMRLSQSGRRRKRDSTTQALDFLNNVNNSANNSTARSSPSSLPAWQLPNKRRRTRQSGDIFDIPLSPEQNTRDAEDSDSQSVDEPITPRRSARLRNQPNNTSNANTPSRQSLQPRRDANVIDIGDDDEESEEGDDLFKIRLFSDDTDPEDRYSPSESSVAEEESESTDLPSTSFLFNIGNGYSESSDDVAGERPEAELPEPSSSSDEDGPESPASSHPPEYEDRSERGSVAHEETPRRHHDAETVENLNAPPSSRRRRSESHPQSSFFVRVSPRRVSPTPPTMNATTNVATNATTKATTNTSIGDGHIAEKAMSSPRALDREQSARSHSRISSSVSRDHGAERTKVFSHIPDRARSKSNDYESSSSDREGEKAEKAETSFHTLNREQSESSYYESSSSISESSADGDDVANDAENDVTLVEKTSEQSKQPNVDNSLEDTQYEEEEDSEEWFKEAANLGEQKENWITLVTRARLMKQSADPKMAKHFEGIDSLISELREIYRSLSDRSSANRGDSRSVLHDCTNLLDGISTEAFGILSKVWNLAAGPHTSLQRKLRAECLVDEFEAHVIPNMVKLVLACFKAYYVDHRLAPGGYHQLSHVLKLVLSVCDRIFNLVTEKYVRSKASSRRIRLPLKRIIKALDSGDFEKSAVELGSEIDNDDSVSELGPENSWTEEEGCALLDGLKTYQGRHLILRTTGK